MNKIQLCTIIYMIQRKESYFFKYLFKCTNRKKSSYISEKHIYTNKKKWKIPLHKNIKTRNWKTIITREIKTGKNQIQRLTGNIATNCMYPSWISAWKVTRITEVKKSSLTWSRTPIIRDHILGKWKKRIQRNP